MISEKIIDKIYDTCCKYCGKPQNGISIQKQIGSDWPKYLEVGEAAHYECYIDECVKRSIKNAKDQ